MSQHRKLQQVTNRTTSTAIVISTTLSTEVLTETDILVSTTVVQAYAITGLARRDTEARQMTVSPSLIPAYARGARDAPALVHVSA
jgi:hypothetical protein